MIALRDYQIETINNVRELYVGGYKAPLLQLPTGGGKTLVFCNIAARTAANNNRAYVLVHRQELLAQTSEKLSLFDTPHGIIAPGHSMTGHAVQVASVQTLVRRIDRVREPALLIIDEAHHGVAGSWRKVLEAWPSARVLGVTATPCRLDGKGLGQSVGGPFDYLLEGPTIQKLTDDGYLAPSVVYAPPSGVDLSAVKMRAGDYAKDQLAVAMDKPRITGCAIEHYKRICQGVPAIAFCTSIKHAEHVCADFTAAGVSSAVISGNDTDQVRKYKIKALGSGAIKVLCACDIISEGTDVPIVSAAILLRPTKSLGLYLQQVGRVLRPYKGKDVAYILDHVGNCLNHGLPDDPREWSLDGIKRKRRRASATVPTVRQCVACFAVMPLACNACPQCGQPVTAEQREIEQVAGELVEVSPEERQAQQREARIERGRAQTMQELLAIAKARGYNPGWAYRIYNARKVKKKKKSIVQGSLAI